MTNDGKLSEFVKGIERQRQKTLIPLARLYEINKNCLELTDDELPPLYAMQKIGSDSSRHFKEVMTSFFHEMYTRFRLNPQSKVFDLGCGSGRLAYPFAQLLSEHGKYYGADVWLEGIELCKKRFPFENMSFHTIPAKNNYYFDDFKPGVSNEFSLDFLPSEELDLIYAISVFTHLIEEDTRAYLREFKRTLKPEGCAFITCFIIDKFFFDDAREKGTINAFTEVAPGHYQAFEGQDFFAGFTKRKWEEMVSDVNLEIVSFERGTWANKPGARTYQDILVLTKRQGIDEI